MPFSLIYPIRRPSCGCVPALALFLAASALGAEPGVADTQFFESKIRPLLIENCFKCHSATEKEKKAKGGLRVDSLAALLKGGDSGTALIAGKPDESKLIEAVRYKNADLQMPPKQKLPDAAIADLADWVQRGAPWPNQIENGQTLANPAAPPDLEKQKRMAEHWAWQPVRPRTPPEVAEKSWPRNALDRFILTKLEEKKLKPAPPADKRTLIRRATFDLIGLPPQPQDVDAFVKDESPDAFGKVVERLLATPQYGERWARHWLDIARYADSNGMDENYAYVNAFRYRDYVITAFNHDRPYGQFVRDQIAGDLLPVSGNKEETIQRQIATGFLAIGPKLLAEPDSKKMEMDIIDEQLDTTGRVFMGLTLGCARCHDHKFDPIPTADYYSLAAIFKGTKVMENFTKVARWWERPLGSKEEIAARDAADAAIKTQKQQLENRTKEANEILLAGLRAESGKYMLAAAEVLRASPPLPPLSAKDVAASRKLNETTLAKWIDTLKKTQSGQHAIFFAWNEFAKITPAQFAAEAPRIVQLIVPKGVEKAKLSPVQALFTDLPPASLEEVARQYDQLFAEIEQNWRKLKEAAKGKEVKALPDAAQESIRQFLYDAKNGPFVLHEKPAAFYAPETAAAIAGLQKELDALNKARPNLPDAMGATEGPKVASLKIHIRGNPQTLGAEVPKRFPRVLASDAQTPIGAEVSGRLQLAEWLARRDHPLVSRVMANRVWRWHFGTGIVNTPDNFGLLGEAPSHPELLDWLATELVEHGGSIKHLHRLIMLSATYQMSSVNESEAPKAELADPENRLHWRMNRRRLEAEAMRDAVLSVSGDLDLTVGGTFMNAKSREYVNVDGLAPNYDSNRRSVYLPIIRNCVYDVLQAFDFPDPGVLNGNRATTTVAPQALFMLNGKMVVDKALKMAQGLLSRTDLDDAGRVRAAYERAFARPATQPEIERALAFIRGYSEVLAKQANAPKEPGIQARAWQGFCQTLMASNEFIYVD